MSKKLLNEGTIRRFMKLAALKPIADEVINEMAYDYKRDELEEEVVVAEEEEVDVADTELEGELELPPEEEVPEEGGNNEDLLKRVVQAVAAELDVEVEIEGDEVEGEGDLEDDLEGDLEGDLGAGEEAGLEAGEEAGLEVGEEEELPVLERENNMLETVEAMLAEAGIEVVDDEKLTEDLVKKVAGRVAKRLLKEFS